jgi:CubicO group peptidase (beta-lactamase class C family)
MRTMFLRRCVPFTILLGFAAPFFSPALRAADSAATRLGFDPVRLQRLDGVIQDQVDRQQIAGGVMLIARDGQTAHLRAYGKQDVDLGRAMTTDAIFRIASMSKAVTSVAVMMLYEEGRFMLRDPIDRFIPSFRDQVVAVPASRGTADGVKFVTEKVKRPIQIRDLLTHTAGLTYGTGIAAALYKEAGLTGWYLADKDESLASVIDRLARLPLHGQPGEVFQYGYSTDVPGRLVEVVSGMPLDRFLSERIFFPLKMVDTCFFLPPAKER